MRTLPTLFLAVLVILILLVSSCRTMPPKACPKGKHWSPELGRCIPNCPTGFHWSPKYKRCIHN